MRVMDSAGENNKVMDKDEAFGTHVAFSLKKLRTTEQKSSSNLSFKRFYFKHNMDFHRTTRFNQVWVKLLVILLPRRLQTITILKLIYTTYKV